MPGGVISLTPSQAVAVHGWRAPLRSMNWRHVLDHDELDFRALRDLGLSVETLFQLQPDKTKWLATLDSNHPKLGAQDLPEMGGVWRIHPIRDLGVSLPQLAMLGLTSTQMKRCGVTFHDLRDHGLTHSILPVFQYSLIEWIDLGITRSFLRELSDIESNEMFQMPLAVVLQNIRNEE